MKDGKNVTSPERASGFGDEEILAWLLGAQDAWGAAALERAMERDSSLALRAATLRAELDPPPALPAGRWRFPPDCVPMRGPWPRGELVIPPVLGQSLHEQLEPGQGFVWRMEDRAESATCRVLVLREVEDEWRVVWPVRLEEDRRFADLPRAAEGFRALHLRAPRAPGRHRFAVVLPPFKPEPDWSAPEAERWEIVRIGVLTGLTPALTFEIQVRDPMA